VLNDDVKLESAHKPDRAERVDHLGRQNVLSDVRGDDERRGAGLEAAPVSAPRRVLCHDRDHELTVEARLLVEQTSHDNDAGAFVAGYCNRTEAVTKPCLYPKLARTGKRVSAGTSPRTCCSPLAQPTPPAAPIRA
jgi:hypothetical protein